MTFIVPKGHCGHCTEPFESGTWGDQPAYSGSAPTGSMIVCLKCAGINELTSAQTYKAVTDAELIMMAPQLQAQLMQMRQNVKTIRPMVQAKTKERQ